MIATSLSNWLWLISLSFLLATVGCSASKQTQQEVYPSPRYPRYLVDTSQGNLLDAARLAVRQTSGRCPLGSMQSGQTAYVFIQWGQDMEVWDAVRQAWAERGVKAYTVGYWDILGMSKEEYESQLKPNLVYGNEAWKEIGNFRTEYMPFFPPAVQKEFGDPIGDYFVRTNYRMGSYLDRHQEIQHLFAGEGGGGTWQDRIGPKNRDKFVGNWIYIRRIDLLSKAAEFPPDLWNLIDEKILEPTQFASEVSFRDPEGTNLSFTLAPDQAKAWSKNSGSSNHIFIYPSPLKSKLAEGGTIVAAGNHTGVYPTMKASLDTYGQVRSLEGGGQTADMFRILLEHPKFKEAKFPKAPVPGYWFLRQDGFATNPKFVRSMPALTEGTGYLPNLVERNRAGIQHLAFAYDTDDAEDREYAKARGIPLEHTAHMHVYFPTVRWKLRDTGEWITIVDKGNVKAFENPEARALAARYGDPDLVFRYEWIPSVPGINAPGEYKRDYAQDPWKWMQQEWKQIKEGSFGGYVDDYKLTAGVK